MNFPPKRASVTRRRLRIALPAVLVFAVACASTPPPVTNLQSAQQAIANAERVDAASNAAAELAEARSKLAAAQAAVIKEDMIIAEQLADEARASAELASARSTVAKAYAVNQDMKNSTTTLIEEMQRKSGDSR